MLVSTALGCCEPGSTATRPPSLARRPQGTAPRQNGTDARPALAPSRRGCGPGRPAPIYRCSLFSVSPEAALAILSLLYPPAGCSVHASRIPAHPPPARVVFLPTHHPPPARAPTPPERKSNAPMLQTKRCLRPRLTRYKSFFIPPQPYDPQSYEPHPRVDLTCVPPFP